MLTLADRPGERARTVGERDRQHVFDAGAHPGLLERARRLGGAVHQEPDLALRAGAVQPGDVDAAGGQRLADAGQRPGAIGGGDDQLGNDRHGDLLAVSAGTERTCPYATAAGAPAQWACATARG